MHGRARGHAEVEVGLAASGLCLLWTGQAEVDDQACCYLCIPGLTHHFAAVQALNVCIALLDRQPAQAPPQPEAPNTGWNTPVPGSPVVPISSELDLQLEALAVQGISQHTGEGPPWTSKVEPLAERTCNRS